MGLEGFDFGLAESPGQVSFDHPSGGDSVTGQQLTQIPPPGSVRCCFPLLSLSGEAPFRDRALLLPGHGTPPAARFAVAWKTGSTGQAPPEGTGPGFHDRAPRPTLTVMGHVWTGWAVGVVQVGGILNKRPFPAGIVLLPTLFPAACDGGDDGTGPEGLQAIRNGTCSGSWQSSG
jgi:hypothetical protein